MSSQLHDSSPPTDEASPAAAKSWWQRIQRYSQLVRLSHTVFALPFALLAVAFAYRLPLPSGETVVPSVWTVVGVILCMVTARSAAMAFNRLVDAEFDAKNPRTASRHIPAGLLKRGEVWGFTLLCCLGLMASCLLFLPNYVPLIGSIPVLAFLLGYSLAKRFTFATHLWLGVALALAPLCAWLAVRGMPSVTSPSDLFPPLLIAGAIACWVNGFDILYSCQDFEFDQQEGLQSIPARFGVATSLRIAAASHGVMMLLLAGLPFSHPELQLSWLYWLTLALVGGLLTYEHALVRPDDLKRVGVAFFNINAIISILLTSAAAVDAWI